ncbi:MAG TPA: zf-HC2 domain-containing protein [Steroidobacter sp.]|nr:zf-HC2 domain-containing protein [Steroidobacter sp.]
MSREPKSADLVHAHEECWERIPWIANRTLDERGYARIEAHLRSCRECREELELQQRVRAAMRSEEAIVLAPHKGLQKLMQRIDAAQMEESTPPPAQQNPRAPQRNRRWGRWAALAVAAQGLLLAVLFGASWRAREEALEAPRFQTLTTPSGDVAAGAVIRVVFEAGASVDEMNAALRSIDAQIVSGPSEAGVYTLALATDRQADDERIDAALARLRADPRVLFAESAPMRRRP